MARWAARALVFLRWLVVPAWIGGAVALQLFVHPDRPPADQFESLLPTDAPAVRAQIADIERFGFPLLARTAVVHRDPDGLSLGDQAAAVSRAVQLTTDGLPGVEQIAGAIPITNAAGVFPGSREDGTTAITYLFFRPDVSAADRLTAARALVDRHIEPAEGYVGVTGATPAREVQGRLIKDALPWVEIGTLVFVSLVVAFVFRSVVAPLITVGAAAIAYVTAMRAIDAGSAWLGMSQPAELEPLIVVLLVGVMTDYAIFFLSGFRRRLFDGAGSREAAVHAAATTIPVVLTAGFTVAGGTAALVVARLEIFSRLGPGMAVAVAVAAVVAVTFIPAAISLLGTVTLWPGGPRTREGRDIERTWRWRLAWLATRRPMAAVVVVVVVGVLVATALQGRDRLAGNLLAGLPADSEPATAARQAARGFVPGVVAPVEVLVTGEDVAEQAGALAELQDLIELQPGVGGVVGPEQQPLPLELGLFRTDDGNAARYVLFLSDAPYSADAVGHFDALEESLPSLVRQSGLAGATAHVTGDTAIVDVLVDRTRGDVIRVAAVALLVDLVLLVVFLRAIVASVAVLIASLLVTVAALAVASLVTGPLLGVEGLTFYVPVAVGVLLLSFGSDYNIYVVGHIWRRAGELAFRDAVRTGAAEASRAVGAAGLALAGSFALLAWVPLASFRQFAIAMSLGVLVDTFVVRTWLVPAILTLLGRTSAWPNRRVLERT